MGVLNLFKVKQKEFFNDAEKDSIVNAIRNAEQQTSGEVRVYVESRCRFLDAIDRAKEIFQRLQMHQTELRNAVLVYVAVKDKQVAVFGDEGIYSRVTSEFWLVEISKMLSNFNNGNIPKGIISVVEDIGQLLAKEFPYNSSTDKNELPDDIVFGR